MTHMHCMNYSRCPDLHWIKMCWQQSPFTGSEHSVTQKKAGTCQALWHGTSSGREVAVRKEQADRWSCRHHTDRRATTRRWAAGFRVTCVIVWPRSGYVLDYSALPSSSELASKLQWPKPGNAAPSSPLLYLKMQTLNFPPLILLYSDNTLQFMYV